MKTPPAAGRRLLESLLASEKAAATAVGSRLLEIRPDNFVARPWGGGSLPELKGIPAGDAATSAPIGESFEVAAWPDDEEAAAHPSRVVLGEGAEIELPRLLELAGREILGEAHREAFGPGLPILPKFLDVRELLSIQAHPPGSPEVYVVVDAEPGATLFLGPRAKLRKEEILALLDEGLGLQRRLADRLAAAAGILAAWLADPLGEEIPTSWQAGRDLEASTGGALTRLKQIYWQGLELLNELPIRAGDVIYNHEPERRPTSATLHALGNPGRRSALLLEIRRPGPTLRAWDHLRFPIRRTEPSAALEAIGTTAVAADRLRAERVPVGGDPRVCRSVANEFFVVDHLRHEGGEPLSLGTGEGPVPQTLHVVEGRARFDSEDGTSLSLPRGHSAIVPASCPALTLRAVDGPTEVVRVSLPLP